MGEVVVLSDHLQSGAAALGRRPRRARARGRAGPRAPGAQLQLVPSPEPGAPGLAGAPGDGDLGVCSSPARSAGAAFFFELGCPASYLAAERVERTFDQVAWIPTARLPFACNRDAHATAELVAAAAREAEALRVPLIIPERFGSELLPAWRAAAFAASRGAGAGARFALAASRLAFCGGYDIGTRPVLSEAARAAGLSVHECIAAAADARWDEPLLAIASELTDCGVQTGPAICIGSHWFQGLRAVTDAAAFCAISALREAARMSRS